LAYADDLVLLAKDEESMKETMKKLERHLRNKSLQLRSQQRTQRSRKCYALGKEEGEEKDQNGSG